MSSAFLPLAFVLGALGGAAVAWWLRGRKAGGAKPAKSRRRYGLTIAAITFVATVAITLSAVYGIIRYKFRKRAMSTASADQMVEDFRESTVASRAGAGSVSPVPAGGIYSYTATGFYEVDAPIVGKDHRKMPATIPAMLVAKDNCWRLTVRFFKQHTWEAHYCRNSKVLAMESWKTANEFFGRKVGWAYGCAHGDVVRAGMKPGDKWEMRCSPLKKPSSRASTKSTMVEFVGTEDVAVGNETVRSHHIRRIIESKGRQSGRTVRDLWFSKTSGLLVSLRENSQSSGMAKFRSDWRLTLSTTTPAK